MWWKIYVNGAYISIGLIGLAALISSVKLLLISVVVGTFCCIGQLWIIVVKLFED